MVCGILVSWPGMEPRSRQWRYQVLTTGPPENSLQLLTSQSSCLVCTEENWLLTNWISFELKTFVINKIDFILEILSTLYVTYDDRDSETKQNVWNCQFKRSSSNSVFLTLGKRCVKSVYLLIPNDTQVSVMRASVFLPWKACCCSTRPPERRAGALAAQNVVFGVLWPVAPPGLFTQPP